MCVCVCLCGMCLCFFYCAAEVIMGGGVEGVDDDADKKRHISLVCPIVNFLKRMIYSRQKTFRR